MLENKMLISAKENSIELLKREVEMGKDINTTNEQGLNLLMYNIILGQNVKSKYEYIDYLIKNGINLNQQTKLLGKTALHLSSSQGNYSIVKKIVEAGADINIADKDGMDALMYACKDTPLFFNVDGLGLTHDEREYVRYYLNYSYSDIENRKDYKKQQLEIIKLLLENGIDKNHISNSGMSAMDLIVENYHIKGTEIVELLNSYDIKLNKTHNTNFNFFDELFCGGPIAFISDASTNLNIKRKIKAINK